MKGDPASARSTLGPLALVVGLVAGFAVLPRIFRSGGAVAPGRDAPEFTLAAVANTASLGEGKTTLSLSELRGRAVVLDFWATWCEPCRLQAPIVEQVARRWGDRGVVVVGVNTDTPGEGDARAVASAWRLTYPIVKDEVGLAARAYGVEVLPTLVVVSRLGKIVAVRTGVTEDAELERLVREAL